MSEQEKILQRLEKYRNEIERIFKERVIRKYEFVEPFCKIKITFDGNKLSYSVADDGICIKLLLIFFYFKLLRLKGDPNTANEPINLPLSSRAYYRPKTDRATSAYLRMMLKGVEPNRAKKWYEKATKKN
ncbi:hypothetical protein DDW13_06755 [Acidianus hospitalis]|uniref:Uncharacterized protein n=1 Tax=Acidianus hospitalis TaxID=563177 RepID=A0A2T9X3E7_9CREN|nr:hypothetical protein DDW13_06755 [Acidianus hospitalis]